jgi:hypothetical protein
VKAGYLAIDVGGDAARKPVRFDFGAAGPSVVAGDVLGLLALASLGSAEARPEEGEGKEYLRST